MFQERDRDSNENNLNMAEDKKLSRKRKQSSPRQYMHVASHIRNIPTELNNAMVVSQERKYVFPDKMYVLDDREALDDLTKMLKTKLFNTVGSVVDEILSSFGREEQKTGPKVSADLAKILATELSNRLGCVVDDILPKFARRDQEQERELQRETPLNHKSVLDVQGILKQEKFRNPPMPHFRASFFESRPLPQMNMFDNQDCNDSEDSDIGGVQNISFPQNNINRLQYNLIVFQWANSVE